MTNKELILFYFKQQFLVARALPAADLSLASDNKQRSLEIRVSGLPERRLVLQCC